MAEDMNGRMNVLGTALSSFALFFALAFLPNSAVQAEVYKWQDAQGRWHFSDAPKGGKRKAVAQSSHQREGDKPVRSVDLGQDLGEALEALFHPQSTIERVTLSVVGIETSLGQGSGFFVSEVGHLVTNRHVLRPATTRAWKKSKDAFETGKLRLKTFQQQLDDERKSLKDYAEKLAVYKKDLDRKSKGSAKSAALAEYNGYEAGYLKRLSALKTQRNNYQTQEKEFKQQHSDFELKSSMAGAARQFKVYLKDNTQLTAQLVHISKKYDLALLKLNGYSTPGLPFGDGLSMRQGSAVFAVGSPLGMRDSVTSGIITRRQEDYLVTDAQILPGNSGGPLLNEAGEVVGVNTLKFSANSALNDGFGFAIPVSVVQSEFSRYLP